MTTREFTLPDVGEGIAEGELLTWLVDAGDEVTEDQPLAEVETDKAVVEVPSPVDGTVQQLHAAEGETVEVGSVIVTFALGDADDADAAPADASDSEPTESAEPGGTADPDTTDDVGSSQDAEPVEAGDESGRVFAPPNVRRLSRELGVDLASVRGSGQSGRLTEQDVRAAAGGADADDLETEGTDGSVDDGRITASEAEDAPDREFTLAVPRTRGIARELDVDVDMVPAVDHREEGAFVTAEAVRAYAEGAGEQASETARGSEEGASTTATTERSAADGQARPEERVPYRGIRRTIGDHMVESMFTAPHVTHYDRADVTALVEMREELKPAAEEEGVNLTYMPFIIAAVTQALAEFPVLNSHLDDEAGEIVYKDYYNIGVAAETDAGLMVPVIDDTDRKSLVAIADELNTLGEKARNRDISPDELEGHTFTVSNFGVIGGEYGTPIINQPSSAILGIGELRKRPWVVGDDVVPRQSVTLSLSYDHRIIDGATAGKFTNRIVDLLSTPSKLFLR